jgi:chromosome partitioning protein
MKAPHVVPRVPGNLRTRGHLESTDPMLIVAVLQQKGGSGKTTLAINLAAAAHLDGGRALVIDMDRQASAFDWSAARQDGSPLDGLAVVKADRAMALPRFKEMSRGYDYVFLDGPPRLGDITQSAAVAADVAVLPIQPGPFDFWAVAETLESLDQADQIREQLGRPPIRRVFVLNRASTNTRLAREAEAELRKAGAELAGVVHQRIAFPDAASRGESVLTSSSTEAAADDIRRLWRNVKGGKHGSEPQETKPRTKREAREGRGAEARRGREAHRRRRA